MDCGHPTIKSSFLGILILGLAIVIPWYDRPQIRVESEPVDLLTMAQMLRIQTWSYPRLP